MTNERCPKCGTPKKALRLLGIPVYWACPLDPKDCRIKELEVRVAQLLAAAEERTRQINQLKEKLRNPEKRFIDLQSTLRAREADVLALRKALSFAKDTMAFLAPNLDILSGSDVIACASEQRRAEKAADEALSSTSATAQEILERAGRQPRTAALKDVWDFLKGHELCGDARLAAAILGAQPEEEKP